MPEETQTAVDWALTQQYDYGEGTFITVTKDTPHALVDLVSQYFRDNGIENNGFSYADLEQYLD